MLARSDTLFIPPPTYQDCDVDSQQSSNFPPQTPFPSTIATVLTSMPAGGNIASSLHSSFKFAIYHDSALNPFQKPIENDA